MTTSEVTVPAPSAQPDFAPPPATNDSNVLSADLDEANRVARERGFINDAFFNFDASTLDADAQETLRRSALWLRDHNEYGLLIEGHCDERGTEQYNLGLGDRRAATAATYLTALGVTPDRIKTVSYGEDRPFEEGSYEAAWAQNRRAHLVLTRAR
jgi:peptidoglycan-associated lipoprotein